MAIGMWSALISAWRHASAVRPPRLGQQFGLEARSDTGFPLIRGADVPVQDVNICGGYTERLYSVYSTQNLVWAPLCMY